MRNLTEDNITDAAIATMENTADPRLKQVMGSLIKHLHGFIRDCEPTEKEWFAGIKYLTRIGQKCDDVRQEYILFSDVLGATILVDAINHRKQAGATASSVLGPFYLEGAPEVESGSDLTGEMQGEPVVVRGRVKDVQGNPIPAAELDVWQTAPNGLYDIQDPDQPEFNLRAKVRADADGAYEFRTMKPVSYPIPNDGPVGLLMRAVGRHFQRPAHIHFIVSAKGYEPVVTQLFTEGDEYLDSDAVFGVKESLVVDYLKQGDGDYTVDYDFVLEPAG